LARFPINIWTWIFTAFHVAFSAPCFPRRSYQGGKCITFFFNSTVLALFVLRGFRLSFTFSKLSKERCLRRIHLRSLRGQRAIAQTQLLRQPKVLIRATISSGHTLRSLIELAVSLLSRLTPRFVALLISPAVPWHVANLASIYRSPSSAVLSLSRNGSFSVSSLFRSSSHGCSSRLLSSHGSSGLSPTSLAPLPTRTFSSPSTRSHITWLSEALVSTV
jgi:hypothetical protein